MEGESMIKKERIKEDWTLLENLFYMQTAWGWYLLVTGLMICLLLAAFLIPMPLRIFYFLLAGIAPFYMLRKMKSNLKKVEETFNETSPEELCGVFGR